MVTKFNAINPGREKDKEESVETNGNKVEEGGHQLESPSSAWSGTLATRRSLTMQV
jgi:hypothetical protein